MQPVGQVLRVVRARKALQVLRDQQVLQGRPGRKALPEPPVPQAQLVRRDRLE